MKKFSLVIAILFSVFGLSQDKNEKEERIPISEFPEKNQGYFDSFMDEVKYLKFHKETDGDRTSYEAKFKINKLHYSVEFDTLGKLEDIEIQIKTKHIPKSTLSNILNYFETQFEKTRIIKIQKQYINNTKKSDKAFIESIVQKSYDNYTYFEIIAEIKIMKKHELREITFNKNGVFKKSRAVLSSSYEHALY